MRFHCIPILLAAGCGALLSTASAQIAALPARHVMHAIELARGIATCEEQQLAQPGASERFINAIQSASPDFFGARSTAEVVQALRTMVKENPQQMSRTTCEAWMRNAAGMPGELACMRDDDIAVQRNKDRHASLWAQAVQSYRGNVPCIGIGVGTERQGQCKISFTVGFIEPYASAAGLAEGDEVLSVAGKPLAHQLDFEVAVLGQIPGKPVTLVVRHDGADITRTLTTGVSNVLPQGSPQCQAAGAR